MPNYQNGVYSNRPWMAPQEAAYPPQQYLGPFASNQERVITQALAVGQMSAAEVQQYVRPPLPQVNLFPSRYGYDRRAYGIEDFIDFTGRPMQRTDYAQQPNTTESTSRNTLGQV